MLGGDRAGRHRRGARTSPAAPRPRATQLSPDQERLCLAAADALGVDYAGVDVLRAADGRDYVLELNGIPGWRGLQERTGADVAAALVAHLEALVSAAPPARAGR